MLGLCIYSILNMNLTKKFFTELAFWFFIKGYEILFYSGAKGGFDYAWKTSLSRFPAELILYYSVIVFIIPAYFGGKKKRTAFIQFTIGLLLAVVSYRIGRLYYFPSNTTDTSFWKSVFDVPLLFTAPLYFLAVPAIKFISDIFKRLNKNEIQKKEAEKQKAVAEMKLLKSQVQPHFLFNTLNNLYSLSLQSPGLAPEFILKLSGIMEYMLYKAPKETVSIEMEVMHIENYVDLEKIRYGNRLEVSWDIDKNLYQTHIAPLLLFPFIENAFKHGTSKDDENTWISISLKNENNLVVYTVVNSVPDPGKKVENKISGQGLKNLRDRLQLTYAGKFEFSQVPAEGSYMSVLRLAIL